MSARTSSSSAIVASHLRRLARYEITRTFPLTYPRDGMILSKDGLASDRTPLATARGIPSTGQISGMTKSDTVIVQVGSPFCLVRVFAPAMRYHSGEAAFLREYAEA